MITKTLEEAFQCGKDAEKEGLHGKYPSAVILLCKYVKETAKLVRPLSYPRRGTHEENLDLIKLANHFEEVFTLQELNTIIEKFDN